MKYEDDCNRCGKTYDYTKNGSTMLMMYKGLVKKTNFVEHDHVSYCSKCSKDLIEFLKSKKHKTLIHWD